MAKWTTTCFRPYLRQAEGGQYRPKHVVVHYIVIKCTSCDTVVFDYIQFFQVYLFIMKLKEYQNMIYVKL